MGNRRPHTEDEDEGEQWSDLHANFVKGKIILSQGFRNNSLRLLLTAYSPVERSIFHSEIILIASTLA
jgi:hypothetical protein